MFSTGQKIFALCFIICFVVVIGYQFYKDQKRNKQLFKGTVWILITLVAIMITYVLMSRFMH
ncbi:MAG: hypothetical protein KDD41_07635 [Flavobacteriales bacterium]|nr:hypothetical protein [Flavobacteriales bacterium]